MDYGFPSKPLASALYTTDKPRETGGRADGFGLFFVMLGCCIVSLGWGMNAANLVIPSSLGSVQSVRASQ